MRKADRRDFIRTAAITGMGLGLTQSTSALGSAPDKKQHAPADVKVGIIGLDTSHSVAFTESLNDPAGRPGLTGFKIVAAYPHGSRDIESSSSRIPGYTESVKKWGVEIVDSIDKLIAKVEVVLLETNDGRLHLEQALPVLKAGKRLFIDKPIAASLADAIAIFAASKKYGTPVFSSSSLRYAAGMQDIAQGKRVGKITGVDSFSPSPLEKTHPDLFWYGIHGVEALFTVMGRGCTEVTRIHTENFDVVAGTWSGNRIGTFRGIRSGKDGYGGTAFGEDGITAMPAYSGYDPLLLQIVHFFRTGVPPVSAEETLEIFAFMEAADESKRNGGCPVKLESMFKKAQQKL